MRQKNSNNDLRRQSARSDQRRQDLVLAAYKTIAQKGFEGLRVRDVASRAGVNIATLHYYFSTKEALIRAVVDHLVHQFLTMRAPLPDDSSATAPQKLRRLFLDLRYQLEQAPQMFIVWTELHLRSQRDPTVRAMLKNLNDSWQTHIEALCKEGLQQQLFRPDLDPRRAAVEVIALIKGISLQAVSQLDTFDFDRLSTDVEQWFSNSKVVSAVSPRTFTPNRGGRKGI